MDQQQARYTKIAAEIDDYYRTTLRSDERNHVKDLDEATEFDDLLLNVNSYARANLVADFSDLAARVTFDVSSPTIDRLIAKDRPECLSTRWINVWHPQRSKSFIKVLAPRYDFSPRLLALMISEPKQPRQAYNDITEQSFISHISRHPSPRHSPVEAKLEDGFDDFSELASVSSDDSIVRGNLYKIIDDIWHYSSIDFGRSYVCIGYNSLYSIKQAGEEAGGSRLPNTMRLWTWLVLCDDNTVISIHEDPFPFSDGRLDVYEQAMLYETRRNLVNIFRSLSKAQQDDLMHRKPLGVFPIRARLGNTAEETAHRSSDMPGLLFYYLFENWHNSYSLITRRESRYGLELKALRAQMFEKPKLCHIDRLDAIGTELDILKRHFESYNRLMDRLLEPQTISNASLQNYNIAVESSQTSIDTVRQVVTERQSAIGVSLSSAVRVRFERLKDLIDLYALAEVQDFIKQKDSLVNMNLQLIAIKESFDVERLTRITLLLTKLTILFLPVSLMAAYFSVPLASVSYTVQDFWISFAVVMSISCSALFAFGVISGSVHTVSLRETIRRSTNNARERLRRRR